MTKLDQQTIEKGRQIAHKAVDEAFRQLSKGKKHIVEEYYNLANTMEVGVTIKTIVHANS